MTPSGYVSFIGQRVRLLLLAVLLAAVQGVIVIGLGLSVRRIFDHALPEGDLREAVLLCLGLLALYGIEILVHSLSALRIGRITQDALMNLRRHLADHAFRLPRSYYSQADLGGVHADWIHETNRLESVLRGAMTVLAPNLFSALTVAVFMLALNLWLSLLCWAVLALGLLAILFMKARVRRAVRAMHAANRQFSKHVLFLLEMMDLIRLRNAEAHVGRAHDRVVDDARVRGHLLLRELAVHSAILRVMVALMLVSLLLVGSYLVMETGILTLGGLLAFFAVAAVFRGALNHVLAQLPHLQEGAESMRRLSRFLDVAARSPYSGAEPCPSLPPIRLEGVTFGYEDGNPLIRDLDLEIEAGSTLTISGPSGSGKSTLALLLLGWYRPTGGALSAGGVSYDRMDMGSLRRRTGVVLQDTWLFSGTIRENLTFGLPEIRETDLNRALALAEAEEFVAGLPDGLDTQVGERGVRLSGGQKQRIAIARALLGSVELLILDEPDNHLDPEYLLRLVRRLRGQWPRLCLVLITHNADWPDGECACLQRAGESGRWEWNPRRGGSRAGTAGRVPAQAGNSGG